MARLRAAAPADPAAEQEAKVARMLDYKRRVMFWYEACRDEGAERARKAQDWTACSTLIEAGRKRTEDYSRRWMAAAEAGNDAEAERVFNEWRTTPGAY